MCSAPFVPWNSTVRVCGVPCAILFNKLKDEKAAEKKRKDQKSKDKQWLEDNKKLGTWAKEAQTAFNKVVRMRDRGMPCISCGLSERAVEVEQGWKPGGAWDCGHFFGVGAFPELRYVFINAWRQCKSCNGGSGRFPAKDRTVSAQYRIRLIERIGLDWVEWLEGPHEIPQRRAADYKFIKELNQERALFLRDVPRGTML